MACVLVADDQPSIRLLLRRALANHDVIEAADGTEALRLLGQRRPDVALLDVMMPGLTGIAVCEAARSDPALSATALVLMSALCRPEVGHQDLPGGADLFFAKPFRLAELLHAIDQFLRPG